MRFFSRLKAVLAAMILGASPVAMACDFDDADGLDVALVFSGGGALASTQVGALTIIDEIGVPVHCVVGTSMGAFAGGLYAAGYSAAELEELFAETPWGAVFRGDIPRRETSFIHKQNEAGYFSDYVIGISRQDGLKLPGGLGTLRGVKALLREKMRHLPSRLDFNELRVPYRPVATNLSTGKAKAFEKGDLVETILASMAVPAAFPARVIDGEVYVDGGMSAQLAVSVAKEMGADIIIAIDTTVEPSRFEGPVSLIESTQQLIQISVYQNWERQIALLEPGTDLLIKPDITGISAASFDRIDTGLERGKAAGEAARAALADIARKAAPSRQKLLSREPIIVLADQLTVDNPSRLSDKTLSSRLGLTDEIANDRPRLQRRLNDLAAYGGFDEVSVLVDEDGAPELITKPRGLGRNLFQVGLQSSNAFNGDSTFEFLARYARRPVGSKGGEVGVTLQFGTDIGLSAELYQPFGRDGRFFLRPELFFRTERVLLDVESERLGEFRERFGGLRVRLGRELGTWGVIGVDGILTVGDFVDRVTVLPDFEPFNYEQGGFGLFATADTLDRSDWPRRGWYVDLSAQRLFDFDEGDADTNKFTASVIKPIYYNGWGVLLSGQYQEVQNDDNDPVDVISVGGFRRLSAFAEDSLPTNQFAYGSVEIFRRLTGTEGITNFPIYAGVLAEIADVQFNLLDEDTSDFLFSGGLYLGADTPIGPVFLGGGLGEGGERALFFSLGRAF